MVVVKCSNFSINVLGYHLFLWTKLNKALTVNHHILYLILIVTICWTLFALLPLFVCVFALPVYLLLGLVCVLVVVETCCELPHFRRLRQRFYQENVRELDSETTHIIDQDHLSDQLSDPSEHIADRLPVIPSVSEQAASLRQESKSVPYTPASGSAVNKKQWWQMVCRIQVLKDLFVNFSPM